ncbi:hypothetical protein BIV57_07570 [Mangrovactinospora gilvigrisea]|uniref:Biotin transporter BioY n=1 Tax=Mangrovactinospora gilvigrisea TaxID=1428644 RepID=A0A1J7BHD5_9ACTN|nr:hypothetical protein [Mangrovactinospora gilvigrisea]OIV38107.1 hypothetical protein BIV57_07570 [Mangrovactinospora gilvigrisea]
MTDRMVRPAVTEVRLTGFKSYRRAVLPLAPLTVLCGPSGAGKSNALDGLEVLSRLALGRPLAESLDGGGDGPAARPVRGGAAGCAPLDRRGFLLGCTVETRHGPIRLDVAVEVRPEPRIVRERLTGHGRILLETLHPHGGFEGAGSARGTLHGAWHSDVPGGQIRAPFDDDRLLTAQLPLRIAGATAAERQVSMAAEEVLVALRGVYPSEPVPQLMRGPGVPGDTMLRRHADNIAAVVERIQQECRFRHGRLLRAVQSVSPLPVRALQVRREPGPGRAGERLVAGFREAVAGGSGVGFGSGFGSGAGSGSGSGDDGRLVPLESASDGLLRFLAFASVLLTGPGVLQMDPVDVPDADRLLTVLAEDMDAGMARGQQLALLRLAAEMCALGHVRAVGAVHDPGAAADVPGAALVHCRRDPETGASVLAPVGRQAGGTEPVRLGTLGAVAGTAVEAEGVLPRQRSVRETRIVTGMPGARVRPLRAADPAGADGTAGPGGTAGSDGAAGPGSGRNGA